MNSWGMLFDDSTILVLILDISQVDETKHPQMTMQHVLENKQGNQCKYI